jgi:hypothetical protein
MAWVIPTDCPIAARAIMVRERGHEVEKEKTVRGRLRLS